jgi:tetratricopeptide (TPR) repeat protein
LEAGRENPDAYVQAFDYWLIKEEIDQARAIVARAEANITPTLEFYLEVGLASLRLAKPRPVTPDISWLLRGEPPLPPPETPRTQELRALGHEYLRRALAIGPEVLALSAIVLQMGPSDAKGALPYARRLVELMPEDVRAWLMLGMYLGVERKLKEAEDALRRAARLARKQGHHDMAEVANDMRRSLPDPFFAITLQMATFLEEVDLEFV